MEYQNLINLLIVIAFMSGSITVSCNTKHCSYQRMIVCNTIYITLGFVALGISFVGICLDFKEIVNYMFVLLAFGEIIIGRITYQYQHIGRNNYMVKDKIKIFDVKNDQHVEYSLVELDDNGEFVALRTKTTQTGYLNNKKQ